MEQQSKSKTSITLNYYNYQENRNLLKDLFSFYFVILVFSILTFKSFSQNEVLSINKDIGLADNLIITDVKSTNSNAGNIPKPGKISGSTSVSCDAIGTGYSIKVVLGATGYTWTAPTDATITTGQGKTIITVNFGITSGNVCVSANNACGTSSQSCLSVTVNSTPSSPSAGSNIATQTSITWDWNLVSGASGFKWNATNTYNTSTDAGINTSYTQTGLNCNTAYTLYVWSYNTCGNSSYTTLTQVTPACLPTQCGSQIWTTTNLNVGTEVSISVGQTALGEEWCYQDIAANCTTYGGEYEWASAVNIVYNYNSNLATSILGLTNETCNPCGPTTYANGIQGICPTGYHIPSDLEWSQYDYCLENTIAPVGTTTLATFQNCSFWCGSNTAGVGPGDKMKITGSCGSPPLWQCSDGGTNVSGFAAIPAGWSTGGTSINLGQYAFFWSDTESNASKAWHEHLGWGTSMIVLSDNSSYGKTSGFSVRCLND